MGLWKKIRPKGFHFSMAGTVLLLFTGMTAYLAFRFPRFVSIRIILAVISLINISLFIRWREKGPSLLDRIMESKFFPRKLSLSKEGKFLFLICIGIGFAAVNTGNNLLYLMFALTLAIITASGILSELSLRSVDMFCPSFPEPVAGTSAWVTFEVTNRKKRLASFSLEGTVLVDSIEMQQTPGFVLKLASGEAAHMSARVEFPRRGVYRLRGIRLSTSYPFSFFTKGRNLEQEGEIVVLPRGDDRQVPELGVLARGNEEEDARLGRGGDFFSVRSMVSGDDWRDVHWKQTARTGRFVVKEYQALSGKRVLVELKATSGVPSMMNGKVAVSRGRKRGKDREPSGEVFEQALELTATLLKRLLMWGYEVGLELPDGRIVAPGSGENALRPMLKALARLGYDHTSTAGSMRASFGATSRVVVDTSTLAVSVVGQRGEGAHVADNGGRL